MMSLFPNLMPASRTDLHFSEFYRAQLRRRPTAKLRSSVLLDAYLSWAQEVGGDGINFRDLRRLMRERGHGHFYSNGAQYRDVVLVEAGQPDDLARDGPGADVAARLDRDERMLQRVDAALGELTAIRAMIAGRAP